MIMDIFAALLGAYLLGSISFGYLAGKYIKGVDIRNFGSGSTGTTNIMRTLGTGPAIFVLALDIMKGLAAVALARALTGEGLYTMLAGVAVIAGHNWPVFFRFRGGRGIATSIGVIWGLAPLVILVAVIIGVSLIALTRYVSLGSIAGTVAVPVLMLIFRLPASYVVFGAAVMVLALWRHRQNIGRLLAGTESRLGSKVALSEKKADDK